MQIGKGEYESLHVHVTLPCGRSLSEVNHLHTGQNGLDTCRIATVDQNGEK